MLRKVFTSFLVPSCQFIVNNRLSLQIRTYEKEFSVFENETLPQRVFVGIGSNIGDRYQNIRNAVNLLSKESQYFSWNISVQNLSFLRESIPMYNTLQPKFINGVVEIETNLSPHSLLRRLKVIENIMGRDLKNFSRNQPRTIDLDILYYGTQVYPSRIVQTPTLTVPHKKITQREFVLSPLCDITTTLKDPLTNKTSRDLQYDLIKSKNKNIIPSKMSVPVLPLLRGRMISFSRPLIMGIANITPDSFSDGGRSVETSIQNIMKMIQDGADIIDIGGESTRPGAKEIDWESETSRILPVVQEVRKFSEIPISIDTRHAETAQLVINAGADIINDVSNGTFDPNMFTTVSDLHVPIILVHSRGNPETMQKPHHLGYNNVIVDVAQILQQRSIAAKQVGIPLHLQLLDVGIGFSKITQDNWILLNNLNKVRDLVTNDEMNIYDVNSSGHRNSFGRYPFVVGISRKQFLGTLTGIKQPHERDYTSIATAVVILMKNLSNPIIFRVHNVTAMKQALQVVQKMLIS